MAPLRLNTVLKTTSRHDENERYVGVFLPIEGHSQLSKTPRVAGTDDHLALMWLSNTLFIQTFHFSVHSIQFTSILHHTLTLLHSHTLPTLSHSRPHTYTLTHFLYTHTLSLPLSHTHTLTISPSDTDKTLNFCLTHRILISSLFFCVLNVPLATRSLIPFHHLTSISTR